MRVSRYATVIHAHGRQGWVVAYRQGNVITHHGLIAKELDAAVEEARTIVKLIFGRKKVALVVPCRGEAIPTATQR